MKHSFLFLSFFIFACQGSLQETIKSNTAYQGAKSKYAIDTVLDLKPIDFDSFEESALFVKMQEEESGANGAPTSLTCLVAQFLDDKEIVYWMHGVSLLFPAAKSTFMLIHPFSEETFFSTAAALSADTSLLVEGTEYGVKIKKGDSFVHLLFSRYWSAGLDQIHVKHASGHGESKEMIRRPFGSDQTAPLYYYESELFPRRKIKLSQCEVFFPQAYKETLNWTLDTWSLSRDLLRREEVPSHAKESASYLYKRATSK